MEPKDIHARSRRAGHLAILHAGLLITFLTWRYGGMDPFAFSVAQWLVLPAPILTGFAWLHERPQLRRKFLWIALPLILLSALVVAGFFNPSMRFVTFWGEGSLLPRSHADVLPSNPYPTVTAIDYGLNLGLVLVGLNLMLTRPSRRWLRGLVAGIALNTTLLAVIGTFFKLTKAKAILGITPSPNPSFFATFVYHNHWGAIALLGVGAAAGLAFHHSRHRMEPFFSSPAPFWTLCAALVLLSIPLSSGRSSTLAATALCGGLGLCLLSGAGANRGKWAAGLLLAALLGAAAAGFLARDTIRAEYRETANALQKMSAGGIGEGRLILYGDTLQLIRQRPWFGWGWGSFQYVHPLVASPRPYRQTNQYEQYALDAHSDWLQFPAEVGLLGTGFILASLAGILHWARGHGWWRSPSREILLGLGALALLASVDFPAACPAVVMSAMALLAAGAELARVADHEPEHA
ncbi:hypothetical protein MASR2M8_25650 [Opitutaceae bacterium]